MLSLFFKTEINSLATNVQFFVNFLINRTSRLFAYYGLKIERHAPLAKISMSIVEGMDTEEKMVETLTFNNDTLNNERRYLAGVVFDNPSAYNTSIPFNISYTIRSV